MSNRSDCTIERHTRISSHFQTLVDVGDASLAMGTTMTGGGEKCVDGSRVQLSSTVSTRSVLIVCEGGAAYDAVGDAPTSADFARAMTSSHMRARSSSTPNHTLR